MGERQGEIHDSPYQMFRQTPRRCSLQGRKRSEGREADIMTVRRVSSIHHLSRSGKPGVGHSRTYVEQDKPIFTFREKTEQETEQENNTQSSDTLKVKSERSGKSVSRIPIFAGQQNRRPKSRVDEIGGTSVLNSKAGRVSNQAMLPGNLRSMVKRLRQPNTRPRQTLRLI